ncbi:DUF1150 family protein [Phreatobacter sp. AB_2022a]|uniref:BQ00720 family protein n=1 Tax=Phreatobacter sp. AB_2022a TaxID=3003134 RepID=UPI00056F140C|nr:DUF1150 domain-containing protein [Phreatobacter sp. AB_2022a]MCZ0736868.1 DUF1150 domain-containing protein [Phreatobacter sp. AB_2022a]CEJ15855.1 hypothetical protein BN1110_06204 [bacterium YEK0313]
MNTFISPEVLARLGLAKVAYVKAISSDDIARVFPEAPPLPPGLDLFALISADGSPILVTDRREEAVAGALQNELETVSLH